MGFKGSYPPGAIHFVRECWKEPVSIESNRARAARMEVAFAASMGWITNIHPDGVSYDRRWHVTVEGMFALKEN